MSGRSETTGVLGAMLKLTRAALSSAADWLNCSTAVSAYR